MQELSYSTSLDEVLSQLKSDQKNGLSSNEVSVRRESYGSNTLPVGKKTHWWELLAGQFINPLIIILLIAAALTYWIDERVDFTVIMLAVGVNVLIGFWQEFRSSQIFEKLQSLVRVMARVMRDGEIKELDMTELVPGDIIILRGDIKVPADARILSAKNLLVNEALLTGESAAVHKESIDLSGDLPLGDHKNMVHMGTIVERGEGLAVVTATGASSEIGKIAALTAKVEDEETPLQERLSKLGKLLAIFMTVFSVVIFIVGIFEGHTVSEMFTVAIAVAVAAIPEGLPAALSVILAVSASRILKRKGLVKKLIGAETLGSTTVIVTDKTGTITEGTMVVEKVFGSRDDSAVAQALAFASDIDVIGGVLKGEATDRAKVQFYLDKGGKLNEHEQKAFIPFDQRRKYLASFNDMGNGKTRLFVSGAPEALIERSTMGDVERDALLKEIEKYASDGYRLIASGAKDIEDSEYTNFEDEKTLHEKIRGINFLGIAAIRDPIRKDVYESIKITRKAGIRVIMATGDHKTTATSIGKELGFGIEDHFVLSGSEIDGMNDIDLSARAENVTILSRVTPAHKQRLVEILIKKGAVVAMTGDGINDAPALKAADIGIAVGSGTDVTKEAADLILMDDSFSTITAAIREGRIAFDNMRKVTVFLLSNSFTEVIIVMVGLVFRTAFLPITAVQILWANLVEDSFPNFALAFEPGEKDIMDRKPIPRGERILDSEAKIIIYLVGIFSDLMLGTIFLYLYWYSQLSPEHIQTFIFAILATNSMFIVFAVKSYRISILKTNLLNNPYLIFAVLISFGFMGVAIYLPQVQALLGTVALSLKEVGIVFSLGMLQLTLIELAKWWSRNSTLDDRLVNMFTPTAK
ncbi:MAG: HAD-IC family P-type ATPase [bacterium]|nr:HAD-IC family P-type ATPase [bacterium]